jgi:hypothetical protein
MIEYEEWLEKNNDEVWISYHESGACYDTHLEDWAEHLYNLEMKRRQDERNRNNSIIV